MGIQVILGHVANRASKETLGSEDYRDRKAFRAKLVLKESREKLDQRVTKATKA